MNSSLLYAIGYLAIAVVTLYSWRKTKDRDFVWFMRFGFAGVALELSHYCLIIVNAPQHIVSIAVLIIRAFGGIGLTMLLLTFMKHLMEKRDRDHKT